MNALLLAVLLAAPPGVSVVRSSPAPQPGSGQASSGGPVGPSAPTPDWGAPIEWFDGTRTLSAWADPGVVAEVEWDEAGATALRAVDASASVLVERPRVRLWAVSRAAAVRAALPSAVAARVVSVYRDAPSPRAAERVLAGGVVVLFASGRTPGALAAWALEHHVVVRQALGASGVLVECPPGEGALRLAASLARVPGVSSATPNWWKSGHPR